MPNSTIFSRSSTRCLTGLLLLTVLVAALLLGSQPATTMATTAADLEVYSDDATAAALPADSDALVAATAAESVPARGPGPAPVTPVAAAVPAVADTTPPAVSGMYPANGAFTGPTPAMGYDFSDPSGALWPDGVHLFIDNRCSKTIAGATDINDSSLAFTPAVPFAEGTHKAVAFICDNLFNCGSTTWYFTVDASAPRITATSPTGTLSSRDVTISAAFNDGTGSGVDTAAVSVDLDGNDISGSCAISATGLECGAGGIIDGAHTVAIEVPDMVGQSAAASWSFTVDTSVVGITGQSPAAGSWQNSATPAIAASFQPAATGGIDPGLVTVRVDGIDVTAQAAVTAAGFSYLPASPLAEGAHTVQVFAADDDGHSGYSEWTFNVDSLAPDILTTSPAGSVSGSTPAIGATYADSLSGVDSATVTLRLDGQDVTAAAVHDGAAIDYAPHDELAAGAHSVQLGLADFAGNHRSATWSFSVAAAPGSQPDTAAQLPRTLPASLNPAAGYSFFTTYISPGRWTISGMSAQPNFYHFPWYDAAAVPGRTAEVVIENQGAGEAYVAIFLGGNEIWTGPVAEAARVARPLPVGSGPIKVICPTGQALEASLVLSGDGWQTSMKALAGTELATTWLLPWYEGREAGVTNTIAIANAGAETAEVEVYIGDSLLPESLKGSFTIAPDSSALAEFPGESGGLVKIVSTNAQPLSVVQVSRFQDSVSLTPAATARQLDYRYSLDGSLFGGDGQLWLMVGNPNNDAVSFSITADGEGLPDPDNPGSDSFRLAPEQARLVPLDPGSGKTVEVDCQGCGFGKGIVLGWRARDGDSYRETLMLPEAASFWH